MAPFNQTDGMWLRGISGNGPIDEVHSLLFNILSDERGNGKVDLNHATLYTALLLSLGVVVPDVYAREYSTDPRFFDSAFSMPAMELAISQFSHKYFPEILGMTLNLEWNVVQISPTISLMKKFNPPMNPQFYEMHVGIDNATSGHGYQAKRAVELYLQNLMTNGSEKTMQEHWQRIFNGYVCFDSTGNVGDDIEAMRTASSNTKTLYHDEMVAMIKAKGFYASLNHGSSTLKVGEKYVLLNSLFANPEELLKALVDPANNFVVPGYPDKSPIFLKFRYDGPMYKVFTDDELQLWGNWITSLGGGPTPPPPVDKKTPAQYMQAFIEKWQETGEDVDAHKHSTKLESNGQSKTVAEWFSDPPGFMRALVDAHYVTPGKQSSGQLWDLATSAMSSVFNAPANIAPDTTKTGLTILNDWIQDGCKLPGTSLHDPSFSAQPQSMARVYRGSLPRSRPGMHYVH